MKFFNELYNYRELLKSSIKKEIRGKYKGSFLGIMWSFINPLLQVLIYAIIFPIIMGDTGTDNYVVFLVVGIIPWTFFVTIINQGVIVIRSNAGIIKKVYFPREILPISVAASGLINFFISCIIILIFVVTSGISLSWVLIFVPFIAVIQAMLALGLVFALSAINIYIKDTEYIVTFILNMLFYATPVLYNASLFPSSIRWVLNMNPMGVIIDSYRNVFLNGQIPELGPIIYVFVLSVVVLIGGFAIFRKLEKGFAEEV